MSRRAGAGKPRRRSRRVPAPLALRDPETGSERFRVEADTLDAPAVVTVGGERVALPPASTLALARWLDAYCGRALPQMIGVNGIAEEFGVTRRAVEKWRTLRSFPPPLDVVGANGPIWEIESVRDWAVEHRPRPTGRPRKR